jgi:pimeloyl-ACP methyl ester carboxylesterase
MAAVDPEPMRILFDPPGGAPADRLVVLLTGTYSEPGDFGRDGFPAAARERGIDAPIAMIGTRAAEVADGFILERLRDEVIEPARAHATRHLWLGGISLGALAALACAARHEADIEGVVLLSPYPGTREVQREIDAAGGLAKWRPPSGTQGDVEREAWSWLASRGDRPRVHLYYGTGDRFAAGQRLMGQALPDRDVHAVEGGHDWAAWRRLWSLFLDEHGAALGARSVATGALEAPAPIARSAR